MEEEGYRYVPVLIGLCRLLFKGFKVPRPLLPVAIRLFPPRAGFIEGRDTLDVMRIVEFISREERVSWRR